MSFYHRYELVKLVNNGDPKSFEARELQTGQPVLLHLWSMGGDAPSSPLLARMRLLITQDPALVAGRLLEVQESAQPPYAVTALEPGFVSIESWLGSLGPGRAMAQPPPVPVQPPPAVPRPADLAGPTVDMPITPPAAFPSGQQVAAQPAPPPPVAAPGQPQFQAPPVQEAGEFTRMFQGSIAQPPVRTPAAQQPPPVPPPGSFGQPPAPAAPTASGPGEFTRLFASPSQAAPPQPPLQGSGFGQPQPSQPAAAGGEMGEFTRLFASPSAAPPTPPSFAQPPAPAQAFPPAPAPEFAPPPPPMATPPHPLYPAPGSQQATFDPLRQPAQPAYNPPPVPAAPPPGSGFTDMFGGPVQQPSSPAAGAAQPTPAYGAPAPPAQSGPSEFEKFFSSPLGASPMPLEEIERGRMAAPPPPPSAKPFRGPGEFTLQFGRDAAKQPPAAGPELSYSPPPPTPQARMSSGATGLFSAPTPDYGPGYSTPAAPSGPGEFTRIIQGPPKQGDSPAPPPAQYSTPPSAVAAPAPQGKSKLMPILMAILSVVVVALLITVVILVLKK